MWGFSTAQIDAFIGSSTSRDYQEEMMLIIRDIFWQTFWRDNTSKQGKFSS